MCLFCASKFALLILLFVTIVHLVDGAKAKKGKKAAAEGVAVPKPSPQKNGAKLKKEEAEQQGALKVNIKYAPRIENENMIPDGELDTFLKANSLKDSPKVVANELPSLEKKKSLNAKKTGVEENLENSQVKGGNGDKMEGIGRHDHGRQDGVGQEDQQEGPPLPSNHLEPQLAQQKQPPQQQEQSFAGDPLLPASNGALSPSSPKEEAEDKENPLSHQNDVPMGGERGKNKEKEEEIEGRENGNNEDGSVVEEGNGSINPTKNVYQQEDDGNKHLNEPKPSAAMGGEMVGDEFGRMGSNGEGEENGVKDVFPSPIHGEAEESQRIGEKAREEEREEEKTPPHGTILEGSETDLKNAEGNPSNGGENEELPRESNVADGIMEGDKKGHHLHTDEHLGKPEGNLREAEMPKEVGHNNGGQMEGGGEENVENGIGGHTGTVRNQNNDQIGGNNDAVASPLEFSNGHPYQSGIHASQKDASAKEERANANLREAEMPVEVRHNNGGQMEGGGRGNVEHGIGGHIGTIRNQNNDQIGGGGHHAVVSPLESSNGHPHQSGAHQEASQMDASEKEERANANVNLSVAEMPVEVRHNNRGQMDGEGEGGSGGVNNEKGEGHNGTVPSSQMGSVVHQDAGNMPHSQGGTHQKSSQKDVPANEGHSSSTGNLREAEMLNVGRNNRGQMDGGGEGGSGGGNHIKETEHNGTVPSIQMGNAVPLDAANMPHSQSGAHNKSSQKDVPAKERHSSGTGNNRPPRTGILASGKENAVHESAPANGGTAPNSHRALGTHEKSVNFDDKSKNDSGKNAAEKNAGNSAAEPINGKRSGTWRNAKKYVEPTMRDLKCEEMEIKDGGERVKCQKWNVIFARINAAENRKKKVIADSKEPSFEIDDYLEEQKEKAKKQSDRERMENGRNVASLKWNMEIYHKRAADGKCAVIGKGQFVGMRMEVLMALKKVVMGEKEASMPAAPFLNKECRWTQAELAEHHILEGAIKEAAAHQSASPAAVHDGHSKSKTGNIENTKVEEKVKKDEKSAGAHAQPNKTTPIEYRKFSVDLKCDKLMIADPKRLEEEMLECKKWEFILSALKGGGRHQFFSLQKTLDQKTKLRVEKCAKMGIIEMNKMKTHGRASALGKISELRAYRKSNVADPKIPQAPALSETADCKWTEKEVEVHLWEIPTKNTPH